MHPPVILPVLLLSLFAILVSPGTSLATSSKVQTCKSVPHTSNWPPPAAWHALNASLSGTLLAPLPPAVVCDTSRPQTYSKSLCSRVAVQWSNSSFHATDPVSVDWPNAQNDGCLPTQFLAAAQPKNCEITGNFPSYVVNASKPAHVSVALKWAGANGVRLSVKGTGHDFLARSTSPGLSIWTHHLTLTGVTLQPQFVPQSSPKSTSPVSTVTIPAGARMRDVYSVLRPRNLTFVGGADPNVGIGGWLTGGGHSPISAKYGLGSDNVVEMEVVTADGNVRVANEWVNSDLFWAMRGGGGATFGVLLSATVRTYPYPVVTSFALLFNSTAAEARDYNNTHYHSVLTYLNSQLPALSEAGLMGYWTQSPLVGTPSSVEAQLSDGPVPPLGLSFFGVGLDLPGGVSDVEAAFAPTVKNISATPGLTSSFYALPPSIVDLFELVTSVPGAVGSNSRIGSRLWTRESLEEDQAGLKSVFEQLGRGFLQGIFTSGPGVRNQSLTDVGSVNPAWRRTYLHVVTAVTYPYRNATARNLAANIITNKQHPLLKSRAPDTGAYINESDMDEPDFQQSYWGDHYARLLQIKRQVDPNGVFWCKQCVGGDEWSVVDAATGLVCKV